MTHRNNIDGNLLYKRFVLLVSCPVAQLNVCNVCSLSLSNAEHHNYS